MRKSRNAPERKVKLRLILNVEYELNGTLPIELINILEQLPVIAASNFMLTGNTTAIVTQWVATVSRAR